jgi:hypothetical protein
MFLIYPYLGNCDEAEIPMAARYSEKYLKTFQFTPPLHIFSSHLQFTPPAYTSSSHLLLTLKILAKFNTSSDSERSNYI